MKTLETQQIVRELLVEADALSRAMYADHRDTIAWRLAALRTTLQRIDRRLGGNDPSFAIIGELDFAYQRILDVAAMAQSVKMAHLLENATRLRAQAHPDEPRRRIVTPRVTQSPATTRRSPEIAPIVLGLAALGVTLVARPLRRSPLAWGVAVGVALASAAYRARRRRDASSKEPRVEMSPLRFAKPQVGPFASS